MAILVLTTFVGGVGIAVKMYWSFSVTAAAFGMPEEGNVRYPVRVSNNVMTCRAAMADAVAFPDAAFVLSMPDAELVPSWPTGSHHAPFHCMGRPAGVFPSEKAMKARLIRMHPRIRRFCPRRVSTVVTVPSGYSSWSVPFARRMIRCRFPSFVGNERMDCTGLAARAPVVELRQSTNGPRDCTRP